MSEIWLGLGSNLGDKRANIQRALDSIGASCRLIDVSSLYKTEPVGLKDQDWFLNCAAKIATEQTPDILLYDGLVMDENGLVIPHPRMHERMFVLAPLREIAPGLVHPVLGKTMGDLAASLRNPECVELYETRGYRSGDRL
jgi:7,8-dihydro-6-hydroxymethylpterin-pyrophosphokinase